MGDPDYRRSQEAALAEERMLPFVEFTSRLRAEHPELPGLPDIAPHYDPLSARVLSLSSNPGPRAGGEKGSGFLSVENDDASAERLLQVYSSAGLASDHVVPWNAFPWYVHDRMPDGLPQHYIEEGVHALHRLLELCPNVVSIVAHGGDAHRSARMLRSTRYVGAFMRTRGIHTWDTRHTSNRAFILAPKQRREAFEDMVETYRQAMTHAGLRPHES